MFCLLVGVVGAEVDGDGGVEAGDDAVEGALLQAHVVHLVLEKSHVGRIVLGGIFWPVEMINDR